MHTFFANPAFTRNPDSTNLLDHDFFGPETMQRSGYQIRKLKYSDCYLGTCMKTVAEFADIAVFLSAATSLRLQGALLTARNRFRNANITQPAYITIENFFNSMNKGSKKFHKIIDQRMEKSADPTTLRTVTTYAMLTGTTVPNVYSIKMC